MKVAFVNYWDSQDINNWSGTPAFMTNALQKQGIDILRIDKLNSRKHDLLKIKSAYHKFFTKKSYQRFREPFIFKDVARRIEKRLAGADCDFVLAPGTLEVTYLKTDKPIVIWTDATYPGLLDYHSNYINVPKRNIRDGLMMEQMAIDKCSLLIYSSEWAVQTAIENYKVDEEKIKVVPFGANIENNFDEDAILNKINSKENDEFRILFVGVQWHRKGGDLLLKAFEDLSKQGLNIKLDIVGSRPIDEKNYYGVIFHGFLDKNNPAELAMLNKLYKNAHIFALPTRAEAYGLAFCEANSFGLPVLGTNTGGVPTIIKNGINGFLLDPKNTVEDLKRRIVQLYENRVEYRKMAINSYGEYKRRLNWSVAGAKVKELITRGNS